MAAVALTLAGCQNSDRPAPMPVQATAVPAPDPRAPVVIGVLHATTGGHAPQGVAANEGVRLAFGVEQPVEVAGRKIAPRFVDTEGKPELALAAVRRLVEQEKAVVLIGLASDLELAAVAPYLQTQQVPLLVTFPWARDLAPNNPQVFQVAAAPLTHQVAGWYAAKRAGYQRAALAVSDYAGGWAARDAFRLAFQHAGGVVAADVAVPLGAPNGSVYLGEAGRAGASAGLVAMPLLAGALAGQALQTFGATPTIVSAAGAVPSAAPPSPPQVEGTLNYGEWRPGLDGAENRTFTAGIRDVYAKEPTLHHYYGYLAAQVALRALTATGGRIEDPAGLRTALAAIDFRGPAGRFRFDRARLPVIPVHLWPGERAGRGAPATIEDVGVDWRVPN